jgi:hypothetical protein
MVVEVADVVKSVDEYEEIRKLESRAEVQETA